MKKVLIAIMTLTAFYFSYAQAGEFYKFSSLEENKVYYAKYITLFEDEDGILWAEDSFSKQQGSGRYCTDHTVAVNKRDGKLYHLQIPRSVKVQKANLDKSTFKIYGLGREKFLSTKILFANSLPDENREYTAGTLPEGKSGWLLTWELFKVGEGKFKVKSDASLEVIHHFANPGLFVKKANGRLLVDKSTFDHHKSEYKLDSIDPNKIIVGSVYTSLSSLESVLAMAQCGAYLGEFCSDTIDAEISEGLLQQD